MMKLGEDNSPNVPKLVALEEAEFEISLFKVIMKCYANLPVCLANS